ncbi:MAG: GTPase HflX [Myxococcales bacterium]|nr:GTPase HflX [Myxococcales bacterium]MCB9714946.1 GTPase HflX [Myxococcales bacterium]
MKFHSKAIVEHDEVPLADDGQWEQLIEHWAARHSGPGQPGTEGTRCYVVSVGDWGDEVERDAQLAEILGLVRAQGNPVVGHETLRRARPEPRTYLGRGAASQIAARAREQGATMLVVDAELSPSQTRNLEDVAGLSVCDREAVILDVFARHARTRKARIQVEIAHLEYLRPRIRGLGLDMDQQTGGMVKARGPGETASELLARRLDGRLAELRKQFARLVRAGVTQRKAREASARVVLVGYTNAGKTSLMNALTDAGLSARDLPFETLDTTSRCLTRHGGDVIISDTVGFIRRLPARLLESFQTTLAEIVEASLVTVVVDLSDPEWRMHVETTDAQIAELGAASLPRLYVFNKVDRVPGPPPAEALRAATGGRPFAVVSSHDPEATARLRERLVSMARHDHERARLFVPYEATELLALIYAQCRVLEAEAVERGQVLTIEGATQAVARLRRAAKEARA